MDQPFAQGQKAVVEFKFPFGKQLARGTVQEQGGDFKLALDKPLVVGAHARTVFWLTGPFAQPHAVFALVNAEDVLA